MKKTYKQLTLEEREWIAIYQATGKSKRAIAKLLDRKHALAVAFFVSLTANVVLCFETQSFSILKETHHQQPY